MEQKEVRGLATNEMQTSLQDGLSALKPMKTRYAMKALHFLPPTNLPVTKDAGQNHKNSLGQGPKVDTLQSRVMGPKCTCIYAIYVYFFLISFSMEFVFMNI